MRDVSGLGTTPYSFFVGSVLSDHSSLSGNQNAHSLAASLDTREVILDSSIENSDRNEVTKEKPLSLILPVLLLV